MFTIMPQDILLFLSALFIFYKNMCIESVWWGIEKITLFYKNLVVFSIAIHNLDKYSMFNV